MDSDAILEKINKSCLKFLLPLSLEDTYSTIVKEALLLVGGDDGMIVRNLQGELKTVYGSSISAATYQVRVNGNSQKAITTHKVVVMYPDEINELPHNKKQESSFRSVVFVPLSYKNMSEGVLILRSTKEKHFSEKQKHILTLFGSFASLAVKKNELYDETKAALEVRDKFISLASHELRTPLTSINGYIQLLHSRMGKAETSEAKWIRELYSESKRMTDLIHELLEINRIKQGQLQFVLREAHLSEIVARVVTICEEKYPERSIVFHSNVTEETDIVIGDTEKLSQVVIALIENAVKFSPRDTEVSVKLSSKNQSLILQVSDKGTGIAREDMARIFDGFYKANDNHEEGMGVGLLLAKHIIQYHKGTIGVESIVQNGTTVEVNLPQQKL